MYLLVEHMQQYQRSLCLCARLGFDQQISNQEYFAMIIIVYD